jgi:hypothetical protein
MDDGRIKGVAGVGGYAPPLFTCRANVVFSRCLKACWVGQDGLGLEVSSELRRGTTSLGKAHQTKLARSR